MNSLRSREGDCPSILGKGTSFDQGEMPSSIQETMVSIQRRYLLRSGMLYLEKYVSEIKCRTWVLKPRSFDPALAGSS